MLQYCIDCIIHYTRMIPDLLAINKVSALLFHFIFAEYQYGYRKVVQKKHIHT